MKLTKAEITLLQTELSRYCEITAKMIMDEELVKNIKVIPKIDYHRKNIEACKDIAEVEKYFLSIIHRKYYFYSLKNLVEREYPQYEPVLKTILKSMVG